MLFCLFLLNSVSKAQNLVGIDTTEFNIFGDTEDGFTLINEKPLTLNMEREMELSEEAKDATKRKEKRRNKKVFYGLKTKKSYARRGVGENVELEMFHYLKDYKDKASPILFS